MLVTNSFNVYYTHFSSIAGICWQAAMITKIIMIRIMIVIIANNLSIDNSLACQGCTCNHAITIIIIIQIIIIQIIIILIIITG